MIEAAEIVRLAIGEMGKLPAGWQVVAVHSLPIANSVGIVLCHPSWERSFDAFVSFDTTPGPISKARRILDTIIEAVEQAMGFRKWC